MGVHTYISTKASELLYSEVLWLCKNQKKFSCEDDLMVG